MLAKPQCRPTEGEVAKGDAEQTKVTLLEFYGMSRPDADIAQPGAG